MSAPAKEGMLNEAAWYGINAPKEKK